MVINDFRCFRGICWCQNFHNVVPKERFWLNVIRCAVPGWLFGSGGLEGRRKGYTYVYSAGFWNKKMQI